MTLHTCHPTHVRAEYPHAVRGARRGPPDARGEQPWGSVPNLVDLAGRKIGAVSVVGGGPRRARRAPSVPAPAARCASAALPDLTHPLNAETAPRRRGGRRAHRRDLRIAKGRRCSAARARSRSSSISIDSSPMCRVAARAPPPRARRDEPLSRARGQPWPAPATRRAGRSPRPPHGIERFATQ